MRPRVKGDFSNPEEKVHFTLKGRREVGNNPNHQALLSSPSLLPQGQTYFDHIYLCERSLCIKAEHKRTRISLFP